MNAGRGDRIRNIDVHDPGGGVWRGHESNMKHARPGDVGNIPAATAGEAGVLANATLNAQKPEGSRLLTHADFPAQ